MKSYYSKAEKAATQVKNIKAKRLNDFYTCNKEIIDEFFRLQKEVYDAIAVEVTAKTNTINEKIHK